jgi:uncharacterized protein (DUF1330 family)
MKTTNPDMQKLPGILAGLPRQTPIVMINLLKFKPVAQYKDGVADYSGRHAYKLYSALALAKLAEIGAEVLFLGEAKGSLIAPPDEDWDEVLLVRYPSVEAFVGMLGAADYRAAVRHRTAAIEDSRLIATVPKAAL